jgi:hypothetical protein
LPQYLADAAFGAAGSIRNRTNLAVLSNENIHRATHASQFQPHISKHIVPPSMRNRQTRNPEVLGFAIARQGSMLRTARGMTN